MKTTFITVTLLVLFASALCLPSDDCPNVYVTRRWDSCNTIEERFTIPHEKFVQLNPNLPCGPEFETGTEVCIDDKPPKPCKNIYWVSEFDTCEKIAKVYEVTVNQLIDMNINLDCKSKLVWRREVCVSQKDPAPCNYLYKKKASTCRALMDLFGTSYEDLYYLNANFSCPNNSPEPYNMGYKTEFCVSRKPFPSCKNVHVVHGYDFNTCEKLMKVYQLTKEELITMNINLDCKEGLGEGRHICVSQKDPLPCENTYKVKDYKTCGSMGDYFGIPRDILFRLNANITCGLTKGGDFSEGQEICISREPARPCNHTFINTYTTYCTFIAERLGVKPKDLEELNLYLDCSDYAQLHQGRKICMSKEKVKPCQNYYNVSKYKTCFAIESYLGVSESELARLNDGINCTVGAQFEQGSQVCISYGPPKPCKQIYYVTNFGSCASISQQFNVTYEELDSMNYYLNCSNNPYFSYGREICISFEEPKPCHNIFKVPGRYWTCRDVESYYGPNRTELEHLNVNIDCHIDTWSKQPELPVGMEVCLSLDPPKPCKRYYSVLDYRDCEWIGKVFNLTEQQLEDMNLLHCSRRSSLPQGRKICVRQNDLPTCKDIFTVDNYQTTCPGLVEKYQFKKYEILRLNENIPNDCSQYKTDYLEKGTKICLSEKQTNICNKYAELYNSHTCEEMANSYKVTLQQIIDWNPSFDCSKPLPAKKAICVGIQDQANKFLQA